MNCALGILVVHRFVRCESRVYIDADGFGLGKDMAFATFTDEAAARISNDIILELNPFRPGIWILAQHVTQHIGQFLRIRFPEPVLIVLQRLHMNPRVLIAVALILVLQQAAFQNDHSQSENVAFVRVDVCGGNQLRLEGLALFWRQVNMTCVALVQQSVVVSLVAGGERVADFDKAFLGEEDHVWSETGVADAFFLQMAQAKNAAGENGPEFSFGESVFPEIAFVDLIIEGTLGVLVEDVEFIESGAVLVLFLFEVLSEGNEVIWVFELFAFVVDGFDGFEVLLLGGKGEFTQKELLFV